jgi:hypothetical protein
VDTDDPSGLTPSSGTPSVPSRRVWVSDPGLTIGMATTVLGLLLLLATPASAADLPMPALPVALPSLPVPTLPLPTLPVVTPKPPTAPPPPTLPVATPKLPSLPPLPTLPVPTPTLPVPTPTLPVPTPTLPLATPTLPLPTSTPRATPRPQPSVAPSRSPSPSPSPSALPSIPGAGPIRSATTLGGPVVGQPVVASGVPEVPLSPTIVDRGSPFDSFVIPGLILGVPAIIILAILAAQLAVGAAWMPVIRRWLNRRV